MAIEKIVNIVVQEKGIDKATKDINKLEKALDDVGDSQQKFSGALQESGQSVLDNGGAIGILDNLTGGYATTVKDAVEASGLFSNGTKIATTVQGIYTTVIGTSTGALKAFKIALITTGVGALVVGLGLLITAMASSTDETEKNAAAEILLGDAIKRSTELIKAQREEIDLVAKLRRLRAEEAGKSEKELRQIERDAHEERLSAIKEEQNRLLALQAQKDLTPERNKEINDLLLANNKAFINEINAQQISDLEFSRDIAVKKREDQAKANEESIAAAKKRNEELRAAEAEYQKQLAADLLAFKLLQLQADNDQDALILENTQRQLDEIKNLESGSDFEKLDRQKTALAAVFENEKISYDARLESAYAFEQEVLNNKNISAEEQKTLIDSVNDYEKRITEAKNQAIRNDAINTFDQIAGLSDKGSVLAKGFAVASATLSGIEGVQNAYTTAQKSPITAFFPAYPIVQAGLAGVFSALQIKKILSVPKSGGGGSASSGGGGGSAAPATPQFNIVGQSGTNQLAQSINSQQNTPVRAYVVSKDMSSQQELDNNIKNTATFG